MSGTPAERDLDAFERRIGHCFADRSLLETALRHASRAHEVEGLPSNERLEFLGDAVIGLVVAHALYEAHPDWPEGDLTRALHALADERAHAELAARLGIGEVIEVGRTEQGGGPGSARILANAFEAVVGALYLDAGLAPVRALVAREQADAFAPDAPRPRRDPKTALQERQMARGAELPRYELVADSGIEGAEERFEVEVRIEGSAVGRGRARSKRRAEQQAARRALESLAAGDEAAPGRADAAADAPTALGASGERTRARDGSECAQPAAPGRAARAERG